MRALHIARLQRRIPWINVFVFVAAFIVHFCSMDLLTSFIVFRVVFCPIAELTLKKFESKLSFVHPNFNGFVVTQVICSRNFVRADFVYLA